MLNSVNCSTVICSPIIEYLCSQEKPLVKPMAPGSILIISISITLILLCYLLCLYFTLYLYHKNTKNLILSYLSDLTLVSGPIGIDKVASSWTLHGWIPPWTRATVTLRGLKSPPMWMYDSTTYRNRAKNLCVSNWVCTL